MRLGFFTTRIVEAPNKQEAELQAIRLVKSDEWLNRSLLNAISDPFVLTAKKVEEAAPDQIENMGYSWYPMK